MSQNVYNFCEKMIIGTNGSKQDIFIQPSSPEETFTIKGPINLVDFGTSVANISINGTPISVITDGSFTGNYISVQTMISINGTINDLVATTLTSTNNNFTNISATSVNISDLNVTDQARFNNSITVSTQITLNNYAISLSDVQFNDVLRYNGTRFTNIQSNLNQLEDVQVNSELDKQILWYTDSRFINRDMNDCMVSALAEPLNYDGYFLSVDYDTDKVIEKQVQYSDVQNMPSFFTSVSLDNLEDVFIDSVQNNQVLKYSTDTNEWINTDSITVSTGVFSKINASGFYNPGNSNTGNGSISSNGAIILTGTSASSDNNNLLMFNSNGTAVPSLTNRSAGAKIILYPSLSGSDTDSAIGVESSFVWFSTAGGNGYKWYHNTTNILTLDSTGSLTLSGGSSPTFKCNYLRALASNSTLNIGDNLTTGVINIGSHPSGNIGINFIDASTIGFCNIGSMKNPGTSTSMTSSIGALNSKGAICLYGTNVNNSCSNSIVFNTSGVNAPLATTRSPGTRIILFPTSLTSADYAIGIEGNNTWFSVPNNGGYKWYIHDTAKMLLDTDGVLTTNGIICTTNDFSINGYDFHIVNPVTNYVLTWTTQDGGRCEFRPSGGSIAFEDITNIDFTSNPDELYSFIYYDGTEWMKDNLNGPFTALLNNSNIDSLNDVAAVSSPYVNNDTLVYNSSLSLFFVTQTPSISSTQMANIITPHTVNNIYLYPIIYNAGTDKIEVATSNDHIFRGSTNNTLFKNLTISTGTLNSNLTIYASNNTSSTSFSGIICNNPTTAGTCHIDLSTLSWGESSFLIGVSTNYMGCYVNSFDQDNALIQFSTQGFVMKPNNPAFFSYLNTTLNNITGDSTAVTLFYDTVLFDNSGSFNIGFSTSGSTFTVPISGFYNFSLNVNFLGITSSNNAAYADLYINSNRYRLIQENSYNTAYGGTVFDKSANINVKCETNDVIKVNFAILNGTKVADMTGISGVVYHNYFSGYLIG